MITIFVLLLFFWAGYCVAGHILIERSDMPRRKRVVPDTAGKASLASLLETKAQAVANIADELRKPASLLQTPILSQLKAEMVTMSQRLQDIAVGVSLGRIEVFTQSAPAAEPELFASGD